MIEWFDDLKLGMLFKGGEVAVTREDIKRFATEFDPQPMHLDEAAAEKTTFKGSPHRGGTTAAMAMSLAVKIRPFDRIHLLASASTNCAGCCGATRRCAPHRGRSGRTDSVADQTAGDREGPNGPPTINAAKRSIPLRPSGSCPAAPPEAQGIRIVREIVCPCVAARIQPKSEILYTLWGAHLELRFRGYLKCRGF